MMKLKKFGKFIAAQSLIAYTTTMSAFAQTLLPPSPIGDSDLISFIHRMLNFAIMIAALIAVGMLIYNGVMYITAAGDEGKIDKATKGITYAVVGLVIAFIAVLLVSYVVSVLTN